MVRRPKAKDERSDVGSLIRKSRLERQDVEAAIARIFDGKTPLPLKDGHALVMPDIKAMTPYSREAIMTTLLLASAVETE